MALLAGTLRVVRDKHEKSVDFVALEQALRNRLPIDVVSVTSVGSKEYLVVVACQMGSD